MTLEITRCHLFGILVITEVSVGEGITHAARIIEAILEDGYHRPNSVELHFISGWCTVGGQRKLRRSIGEEGIPERL